MTQEDVIRQWLHGRSPHTQRAFAADVARLRQPIETLTLTDLQAFAESLNEGASRHRAVAAVKSLLSFAYRIGFVSQDAGRLLRLPPVRPRLAERILPEADVLRMIALEPDTRNRAILTTLYASGVRVSELCGLCWRDVQPSQIAVLGKGREVRSIRLPDSVCQLLESLRPAYAGPNDRVFPIQPLAVYRIVRKAAIRAGLSQKVSPHWLRHAHASHALDRGAPIHLVQATLGHSSLQTTSLYLHAKPTDSSGQYLAL